MEIVILMIFVPNNAYFFLLLATIVLSKLTAVKIAESILSEAVFAKHTSGSIEKKLSNSMSFSLKKTKRDEKQQQSDLY